MPRPLLLAALLVLLAGLAGCAEKEEPRVAGETEGVYLDLNELRYQVQVSRILNEGNVEDQGYLSGIPEGVLPPSADETWFGIFLRVFNSTDEPIEAADDFEIRDTQQNVFRPVALDPQENPFAYRSRPVPAKGFLPLPNSAAFNAPPSGGLVLFKLDYAGYQNRPLEFVVSGEGGDEVLVDLDL